MEEENTSLNPGGVRLQSEKLAMEGHPQARFVKERAVVSSKPQIAALRSSGIGRMKGRRLVLSPYEVLYLLERGEVSVHKSKSEKMGFLDVLNFYKSRPRTWTRYLIYRDLRNRGYLVRQGRGRVDFVVKGKSEEKDVDYAIVKLDEGGYVLAEKLLKMIDESAKARRNTALAVVDRRNEIIYYELSTVAL